MYLEIVTPEASLVSGEVESVSVPGVDGEFQMLNNHAAIVSSLQKGKVLFKGDPEFTEGFEDKFSKDKDGRWSLEINSGTLEMQDNKAIILAD
ncbi:MAG: F0F1 ATP synthase subunit epsilon [Flavobacteriaceae bacterium]|nr:F0F1 ATP synthase subunit epsilon [Flavobacteriaceae bacterium]